MALSVALDLIGGEVFNLLSGSVTRAVDRKAAFRELLQDMKWTLKSLKSQARVIQQIQEHNLQLSLPNDEIIALVAEMTNGKQLVDRLSGFRFRLWNFCCTNDCADQLRELNRSLECLFDNLHLEHLRDGKENLILSRKNHDDLHEVKATLKTIVQKIDDLEVKGRLLNKLREQNGGHSMKASTSASGSNTHHEGNGEAQASSLEGLVEAAFLMLFEVVIEVRDTSMMFRPFLRHLKSTLDFLKPFIEEIAEHNKVLDRPKEELESLRIHMMKGVLLVRKCSIVRLWTCSNKKYKYTNQLFELDESLQWQSSIFTEQVARDVRETSNLITDIQEVLKQIEGSGILQNQSEFKGSCDLTESATPTVEVDVLNLQGTRGVMKETLFSAGDRKEGVKEIEGSDEVPGLAVPQMPTVRSEVQYSEGRDKMSRSSARETKDHETTEDSSPTLESDVQNVQETRDEMKSLDSAIDIEEKLKGFERSEVAEDPYEVKGQEGEKLSLTELASLNEFLALKRSKDVNLRNKIIEQIEDLAQKGTKDVNLQNKITVGEIFLAAFVQLLLDRLTTREILSYFGSLGGVGKKLQKWTETLSAVAVVLYDAEQKQLTSKTVDLWLNDLKHLAYDMDDLLDTFSSEMLARKQLKVDQTGTSKVRGFFTKVPHKVEFNFSMNSEIDEIANRLQDIFDRKEKLGLKFIEHTSAIASSSQRTPSSYVLDGHVVGRDEDTRKIVELLSRDVDPSSPTNYQVVAIVGMGGLGKTTLAGQVFNDVDAVKQFDLKVWVSVSDDFNLETVTRTISKKVTSRPCDMDDFSQLQDNLSKGIDGKKFLIVLDDVWSTCDYDSWTKLQAPFRGGAKGSKIMVTTREKKVAALMGAPAAEVYYLKTLSDRSCLQVFEQHVGNDRPPNFGLLKKEIVKKCNGLPLAAKTLGGVLRCKETDKWEEILNDKLWSISDGSNILPVLRLSYHYLPSTLKRCFAYCSILPDDYEFRKNQLILLWMAEGFLEQPEGTKAMEDIGDEYFGELLSRSLFQTSGKTRSCYVMHDFVGDLARWAAGDTFCRLEDKLHGRCSPKTRHLTYIYGKFDGVKRFQTFSEAKHLRTVLPLSVSYGHENYLTRYATSDLLAQLKYLRVLSFNGYKLTELPDSVGNLRHLRYLDLSHTLIMSLPESTCMLYNLQTLILENCSKLKTLPSNMSNLTNLRHLINSNTPSLEEMPPQVSRLTHLQSLPNFVVGKGSVSEIGEIGSLHLRGALSLRRLENVIDVGDAKRAQIMNKEGLTTLQLEWSGTSEKESEVLCSLEPHKKLLHLRIEGYNGFEFSKWIGHPSFSDMISVKLENCKNCRFLPPLGQLPFLKILWIQGLANVKSVGAEFYGECSLPFPVLEALTFKDMHNWNEWLPCKRDEEIRVFPCMKKIFVLGCPKLKGWLPKNMDSLSELYIDECEELVVSIANYKHIHKLTINGCKRVVHRGGVKFELLDYMGFSNIPVFRLEIDGFIRGLPKLQALSITGCEELTGLWANEDRWLQRRISNNIGGNISHSPSHFIEELRALKQLVLTGCSNLISLPESGWPPCLEYVKMESCNSLTHFVRYQVPPSIKRIEIAKCQNLKLLVKDAGELEGCLEYLEMKVCASLTSLSGEGGRLPKTLKYLLLSDCEQLESISKTFHDDTCLERIEIERCANLKSLPEGLCHLSILRIFKITECASLVSFPRGGLPSNLTCLCIFICDQLEAIPRGMDNLSSLQALILGHCGGNLASILEEGFPPNLIYLRIADRKSSKPLSGWGLHHLDRLTSLKELTIAGVDPDLVSFPPKEVLLPKSLIKLVIDDFPNLKRLSSSFQSLTSLESLDIWRCPKLASIIPAEEDHLPLSLTQLRIHGGCPLLTKKYQPGEGRQWPKEIAHIPYVYVGDYGDEAKADRS